MLQGRAGGIRAKLVAVTLVLIALITSGSSLVVIRILDQALLQSLLQRGRALAISATTPAGYSILSGDRLALDNLAAKIAEAQPEVVYLAILDLQDTVLAHSRLGAAGGRFEHLEGIAMPSGPGVAVREVLRDGLSCFEFQASIQFAGRKVGEVVVAIDTATYRAAKGSARSKIFWITLLALGAGLVGTLWLATRFTTPIERLAAGVGRIRSGDYGVAVAVTSRDELGELTTSFNAMARTIQAQKEGLEGSASELEEAYVATVRILAAALDARDNYTLGHSARVAALSLRLGRRLGLGQGELRELEMACFLHDIGKIGISDTILHKPGKLTDEEWKLMRIHTDIGARIVEGIPFLQETLPVIRYHHERWDGSGYPIGLKNTEIPIPARIFAIADVFDALTSKRSYRKKCSAEEAIQYIQEQAGILFDPLIVEVLTRIPYKEFTEGEKIIV